MKFIFKNIVARVVVCKFVNVMGSLRALRCWEKF